MNLKTLKAQVERIVDAHYRAIEKKCNAWELSCEYLCKREAKAIDRLWLLCSDGEGEAAQNIQGGIASIELRTDLFFDKMTKQEIALANFPCRNNKNRNKRNIVVTTKDAIVLLQY